MIMIVANKIKKEMIRTYKHKCKEMDDTLCRDKVCQSSLNEVFLDINLLSSERSESDLDDDIENIISEHKY